MIIIYVVVVDSHVYGQWTNMIKAMNWAEAEFPIAWAQCRVQVLQYETVVK